MLSGFTDGGSELQPSVEPLPELFDQAHVFLFPRKGSASRAADSLPPSMETKSFLAPHGDFSVSRAIAPPGVGNSPAWMVRIPSCTLVGYSNSPRSGGPEAREPSW